MQIWTATSSYNKCARRNKKRELTSWKVNATMIKDRETEKKNKTILKKLKYGWEA